MVAKCLSLWTSQRSRHQVQNRVLTVFILILLVVSSESTTAQEEPWAAAIDSAGQVESFFEAGPEHWTSRKGLHSSLQVMLMLTVLSLAPAMLIMTTSFVRIIVVLGLLRQALGTQQLPPSQVITSLSLFMTFLIMSPVWKQVYDTSIAPYAASESELSLEEAWENGQVPIKKFMFQQIESAENFDDVYLFLQYLPESQQDPKSLQEVPITALVPAYILSELKTAFLIGFQIYLPFLILDIVIASVTISMGMLMLPPAMISLPFKLMLFVLVDGWHLVVEMLLASFGTFG